MAARLATPIRLARAVLCSGVPAFLAAAAAVVAMLVLAGTPSLDILRYAAYWVLLVVLPGYVLWRCVESGGRLADDLAAGAATGLAVELFAYMAAAAAGVPRWYAVVPAAIVVCGVAVPALRRRVFRKPRAGYGAGTSWLIAAAVVAGCAFVAHASFPPAGLVDGYPLTSFVDMSYQLALAAEAKHHFPMTTPFVAGQPLHYQYFVHLHLAAASWSSGVDLPVVVSRLFVLPFVAVTTVLTAALAGRLGARRWAAGIATVVAVASLATPAGVWNIVNVAFVSPTQSYALVLLGGLGLLVVDVLRHRTPRAAWAVLALLLGASTASKGTVLPLVIGGLCVTVACALARRAGRTRALATLGIAGVAWGAAEVLVFAGERLGLTVSPLHVFSGGTKFTGFGLTATTPWPAVGLTLLVWTAPIVGALVVVIRARFEAGAAFVCSVTLGAVAGVLLLGQSSYGESYFVRTAAGFGAAVVGAALSRPVSALARLRGMARTRQAATVLASVLLGAVVVATVQQRAAVAPVTVWQAVAGPARRPAPSGYTSLTLAEVRAARWLRSHAGTGDVVATNEHCRPRVPHTYRPCDGRDFWLAGASERRVLVQGWAYTTSARTYAATYDLNGATTGRFPDPSELRANDAAFDRPTAAGLRVLRDRYSVRWLYAVGVDSDVLRRLDTLATPRFTAAEVRVYELP
ncbi:MAG: hypothetical protein J2P24_04200 [Streptosporangiales bacterium]|nr:hypothetical protein [Streptosporangiales bacterium]MBO0890084.1 hypothetical protein [Acidothermales bacterium]